MAPKRIRRHFDNGRSRVRFGGLALIALIGFLPAACGAQPKDQPVGGWVQFAANETPLDSPASDAPPRIESPFGAFLAGVVAEHQRDLSVAADYMLQSLKADPDSPELLSSTFNLVAGNGRQEIAVELAKRMVAIEPEHAMANLVLALDGVHRGDLDAGQDFLAKLPQRGLGSLLAPLLGGWMKVAQGDPDAGLEAIAGLADVKGFELLYQLHRALMEDVSQRPEAARLAYEEALGSAGGITLRLAWISGNFFERNGGRERAIEIYSEFLADNPGSSLAVPLLRRAQSGGAVAPEVADAKAGMAEVLFNLASLLSQERAENLALIHVQQALHLKPDFVVARVLLGEILEGQDRTSEAIEVYRKIPDTSPFAWTVRLRIAEQLERLDETELALAELDSLAASRETQFEPLYRKGNLLRSHERFEEAIGAYDGAMQRIGEPEPRHWSLFYFRGIALERSGNWERAESDFLKALELQPEQPFVMNYLAYSWVEKKKNLDQAKEMLLRAVELRPEDGFIVDSLGWVYYRLGEYENGVTYLEQAVELRPQDPVINDHLGDVLWRVGRRNEARFQWRRALSLDPEADQIPIIEKKLEEGVPEKPKDI